MMGARSAGLKGRLRKTCQECLDSPSCKPQDETSFFCFCRGISARFVCVSVLHGVRPPARAQSALQDLKSGSDCTAEGQTALTGSELQPPVSTANEISSWSKWCVSAHTRAHTHARSASHLWHQPQENPARKSRLIPGSAILNIACVSDWPLKTSPGGPPPTASPASPPEPNLSENSFVLYLKWHLCFPAWLASSVPPPACAVSGVESLL